MYGNSTQETFLNGLSIGDGCWEWRYQLNSGGYGIITIRGEHRQERVSRYSYKLFRGPISRGLRVCHTCDNPKCAKPSHLFLGTSADNMKDAVWKGRHVGRGKLSLEHVAEIREASCMGESNSSIARRYRIAPQSVSAIVRNKVYVQR
jgi:hypothetical protein